MFSGIVIDTGKIHNIYKKKNNSIIEIISKIKFSKKDIGSSISCSGVCLTLVAYNNKVCKFFLSLETLNRTNFKYCKKGDLVNLEKSLKFGKRLSGHFVQGHVDTTSKVRKITHIGKSWLIDIVLPKKFSTDLSKALNKLNFVWQPTSKSTKGGYHTAGNLLDIVLPKKYNDYIVYKGSISINGVSLTIAKIFKNSFQISIIPHTLKMTNLTKLKLNDVVNIEFDILAKYIRKVLK